MKYRHTVYINHAIYGSRQSRQIPRASPPRPKRPPTPPTRPHWHDHPSAHPRTRRQPPHPPRSRPIKYGGPMPMQPSLFLYPRVAATTRAPIQPPIPGEGGSRRGGLGWAPCCRGFKAELLIRAFCLWDPLFIGAGSARGWSGGCGGSDRVDCRRGRAIWFPRACHAAVMLFGVSQLVASCWAEL